MIKIYGLTRTLPFSLSLVKGQHRKPTTVMGHAKLVPANSFAQETDVEQWMRAKHIRHFFSDCSFAFYMLFKGKSYDFLQRQLTEADGVSPYQVRLAIVARQYTRISALIKRPVVFVLDPEQSQFMLLHKENRSKNLGAGWTFQRQAIAAVEAAARGLTPESEALARVIGWLVSLGVVQILFSTGETDHALARAVEATSAMTGGIVVQTADTDIAAYGCACEARLYLLKQLHFTSGIGSTMKAAVLDVAAMFKCRFPGFAGWTRAERFALLAWFPTDVSSGCAYTGVQAAVEEAAAKFLNLPDNDAAKGIEYAKCKSWT